jgi:uncharacterized membrane protein
MNTLVRLVLMFAWIAGIVLAKGFWSTFFAIVVPLWSYYLVVERIVERWL